MKHVIKVVINKYIGTVTVKAGTTSINVNSDNSPFYFFAPADEYINITVSAFGYQTTTYEINSTVTVKGFETLINVTMDARKRLNLQMVDKKNTILNNAGFTAELLNTNITCAYG